MNIRDLAALIAVRNYAVGARENKNVFRGNTYQKINIKIAEIDSFLADELLNFDLSDLEEPDTDLALELSLKENYPESDKKKNTLFDDIDNIQDKQITLDSSIPISEIVIGKQEVKITADSDKTKKAKEKSQKAKASTSDEDAALIANRVAAQKAALQAELAEKKRLKDANNANQK